MDRSPNSLEPGVRRYLVTVLDRTYVIDLRDGPAGLVLRVDGEPASLEVESLPGHFIAARVESESVRALARVTGEQVEVVVAGEVLQATVEDHRRQLLRSSAVATASQPNGEVIRAPMPGLVVSVPVAVGDTADKGATVVVLQAMKMENELRATTGGRVADVRVQQNQTVEQGQVLVVLE